MLDYEIKAFGGRLGLEALSLSQEGVARLDIDGMGSLFLELGTRGNRRELMVYLSAKLPEHDAQATRRLLELCDYRQAHPMPLSAGVFSGQAVVLTRIPEEQVTAMGIENAVRFLAEMLYSKI